MVAKGHIAVTATFTCNQYQQCTRSKSYVGGCSFTLTIWFAVCLFLYMMAYTNQTFDDKIARVCISGRGLPSINGNQMNSICQPHKWDKFHIIIKDSKCYEPKIEKDWNFFTFLYFRLIKYILRVRQDGLCKFHVTSQMVRWSQFGPSEKFNCYKKFKPAESI